MIILDGINLPEFIWLNRTGYTPWRVSHEYALDGSQHIEVAAVQAGRAIVLYCDSVTAEIFDALEAHAVNAGANSFALQVHSNELTVMWDYQEQPVTGYPLFNYSDQEPEIYDTVNLRLITV